MMKLVTNHRNFLISLLWPLANSPSSSVTFVYVKRTLNIVLLLNLVTSVTLMSSECFISMPKISDDTERRYKVFNVITSSLMSLIFSTIQLIAVHREQLRLLLLVAMFALLATLSYGVMAQHMVVSLYKLLIVDFIVDLLLISFAIMIACAKVLQPVSRPPSSVTSISHIISMESHSR
ncbi:hypothetical protein HDE_01842 [Halotydeus destructor]|nr:hypothetical protein HDE_01842 [Halotydeus destructor]